MTKIIMAASPLQMNWREKRRLAMDRAWPISVRDWRHGALSGSQIWSRRHWYRIDASARLGRTGANQTRWPSLYARIVEGNVMDVPLPDASIDAVVSQEAFCHVPDVKRAVAEAFRILRTDGRLAFTDWIARPCTHKSGTVNAARSMSALL